jgi:hypothetical protein
MIEFNGNLWDYHKQGRVIGVTTNGDINAKGRAVMGRGIALQASKRYPQLSKELAKHILDYGNNVAYFGEYSIVTIPVKHHWNEPADLDLIKQSCYQLMHLLSGDHNNPPFHSLYIPRPGCGNGGLDWSVVRPIIATILDDRFAIVEWGK